MSTSPRFGDNERVLRSSQSNCPRWRRIAADRFAAEAFRIGNAESVKHLGHVS
jgi:hypothetical protein